MIARDWKLAAGHKNIFSSSWLGYLRRGGQCPYQPYINTEMLSLQNSTSERGSQDRGRSSLSETFLYRSRWHFNSPLGRFTFTNHWYRCTDCRARKIQWSQVDHPLFYKNQKLREVDCCPGLSDSRVTEARPESRWPASWLGVQPTVLLVALWDP